MTVRFDWVAIEGGIFLRGTAQSEAIGGSVVLFADGSTGISVNEQARPTTAPRTMLVDQRVTLPVLMVTPAGR